MQCCLTAIFAVFSNRRVGVWVKASRVVWQEDSLFLIFFTLVMGILCVMICRIEGIGS